jgi:hypothetical protein
MAPDEMRERSTKKRYRMRTSRLSEGKGASLGVLTIRRLEADALGFTYSRTYDEGARREFISRSEHFDLLTLEAIRTRWARATKLARTEISALLGAAFAQNGTVFPWSAFHPATVFKQHQFHTASRPLQAAGAEGGSDVLPALVAGPHLGMNTQEES